MMRFLLVLTLYLFSVPANAAAIATPSDNNGIYNIFALDVTGSGTATFTSTMLGPLRFGDGSYGYDWALYYTVEHEDRHTDQGYLGFRELYAADGTPITLWNTHTVELTDDATSLYFWLSTQQQGIASINVQFDGGFAAPVPEPSTWAMMLLGFAGIAFMKYRRRSNAIVSS